MDAPFGPKTGTNRERAVRIQAYILVMLPMICADPPGFDRAAFHKQFDAEIVAFFQKTLGK